MKEIQVPEIYYDMAVWTKKHIENNKEYANLANNNNAAEVYDQDSIYDDFIKKRNEIGTEFDFMEGKDAKDEKQYLEQLDKLATGDMVSYDLDGDGKVNKYEYMAAGLKYAGEDSNATQIATAKAYLLFDTIDGRMPDSSWDGTITQEEFMTFYKYLDKFDGEKFCESDGKISIDGGESYVNAMIYNLFGINSVESLGQDLLRDSIKEV